MTGRLGLVLLVGGLVVLLGPLAFLGLPLVPSLLAGGAIGVGAWLSTHVRA